MTIEDLALYFTKGIGSRGAAHLVEHFETAERLFSASKEELTYGAGLRSELAERILAGEGMREAEREIKYCQKHDIRIISATDEEYPEPLRATIDRPHILFVLGEVSALSKQTLAMVGTREISPSGIHSANILIKDLSEEVADLCIVSGLAYGADSACHRAALANGVTTVAIIPSTLPSITPTSHEQLAKEIIKAGGAIVSELSSQTRNNGSHFISRNRIIAGMSLATLVVESPAKGGSLSTADIADSYSRTVLALPGRITDTNSFGTNNLIRSGKARLVLTADDIIEDAGLKRSTKEQTTTTDNKEEIALTESERKIIDAFKQSSILDWSELLASTGLSMGELAMVMMDLEFKGAIRTLPGKRYEVI